MRVKISNIKPGMVLTEPIVNSFGQLMLASGTALTRQHLNVLKSWGIAFAEVDAGQPGDPPPSAPDPALLQKAAERLGARMPWTPRNALEEEVHALALEFAARRVANGETTGIPWNSLKSY